MMDRKYRVLLIDDDEALFETYTRLFKRVFGTEVILSHCFDLKTCEKITANAKPDMILLDQKLKGGDIGLDLVDQLRERYPLARIVVNSAYGSESLAISSIRKGVDDFVEGKKENLDALVNAVKRSMVASEELVVLDALASDVCYGGESCREKIQRVLEKHSKQ